MFKEIKEKSKELKKRIRMMSHQIENISTEQELQKRKNQIELLEFKSTITDKHFIRGTQWACRHEQAEKKLVNLKTGPLKLTYLRNKRTKKNEQRVRGLWDTMQHTNIEEERLFENIPSLPLSPPTQKRKHGQN